MLSYKFASMDLSWLERTELLIGKAQLENLSMKNVLVVGLGSASRITAGGRALLRLGGHPDLPTLCKLRIPMSTTRETHDGC